MDKKGKIRLVVLSVIIILIGIFSMIWFKKTGNEITALFSDLMFTIAGATIASLIEIQKKYRLILFSIVMVSILAGIAFGILFFYSCEYWECGLVVKILMMLFSFVFSVMASYYVSYSRFGEKENDVKRKVK